MASPEVKTTKEEGNIPMQSYYNTFNQQTEEAATGIIEEAAADIIEQDSGVTYFVDEEGCYYYQLDSDDLNLVSLPTGEIEESDEVILNEESHVLVDSEAFQTVTLVPSETGIGQISSVLVVQEESKTIVNLNIKVEHKEDPNEDTNIFQAEEEKVAPAGLYDDSVKKEYSPGNNKSKCNLSYFTCNFCPYSSCRRYLLLRHMKSHSGERLHKCSVCERRFKSRATLQNHVNAHKGVKPHVCKYCDSPFTTSGELSRHVRYKHTHEKPYKCTECDYASVESSKLRCHIRCHTGERPYKCPHCTYASVDNFKLKRHLRTHTGEKPYKCEYCNLCFTQSNSLKAHKQIHNVTEKPVYACELCPARCRRKTDLRIHIQRLHTSNTSYKCKICGKLSPDLYSSKLHNKTHRGEKCFKCHLCAYASMTPRRLRSHMLKHTDEKPFICEQCDQSFRQKDLPPRRHQNLYHNPCYVPNPPKEKTHICHECNRSFAYNGNLIRHLAVHHLELEHQDRILSLKLDRPNEELDDVDKVDSDDEENNNVMIRVCDKEMKRAGFMTVSNEDGQKYLVFEIIHLENGP